MLKAWQTKFQKIWNRPKVAHIVINNFIDINTTYQVSKGLKNLEKWHPKTKAIFLTVNSSGGSSSQALIIQQKLKYYCKNKNIPLYTFAEEYATSAAYLVLCAGDKIYVANHSIVGSIGAIYQMWYMNKLLTKHGIEYRSITTSSGNLTSLIDPLDKYNKKKVNASMTKVVADVHNKFTNMVTDIRGDKLVKSQALVDGEIFLGTNAVKNGLADEASYYTKVLNEKYPDAKIISFGNVPARNRFLAMFEFFQIKSESDFMKRQLTLKIMKQKKDISKMEENFQNYYF